MPFRVMKKEEPPRSRSPRIPPQIPKESFSSSSPSLAQDSAQQLNKRHQGKELSKHEVKSIEQLSSKDVASSNEAGLDADAATPATTFTSPKGFRGFDVGNTTKSLSPHSSTAKEIPSSSSSKKDLVLCLFSSVVAWYQPEEKKAVPFDFMKELRDKVLLLIFFQSTCRGCHVYIKHAIKPMYETLGKNDKIRFLAIQTTFERFEENTPESAQDFQSTYKLQFPVGHDGPVDISELPEAVQEKFLESVKASSADSSNLPSSLVMKLGAEGTPWSILIAPQQNGMMKVLFNSFRFDERVQLLLTEKLLA
eukprot:jgi/Bigna1/67797/fgenesh1_pg.4_\